MTENLKILKEKRHRSSSSLITNNYMEGPYAEKKRNLRGSIPEGEDQFDVADSRCDELKEQLDLVKALKSQKAKLKKRSMTKMNTATEDIPVLGSRLQQHSNNDDDLMNPNNLISVQARLKKKLSASPPGRLRKFTEPNRYKRSTRSHNNTETSNQHHMIANIQDYDPTYTQEYIKMLHNLPQETSKHNIGRRDSAELHRRHRRHVKTVNDPEYGEARDSQRYTSSISQEHLRHTRDLRSKRSRKNQKRQQISAVVEPQHTHTQGGLCKPLWTQQTQVEERPVVELFNKSHVKPQRVVRNERDSNIVTAVADTHVPHDRVEFNHNIEASKLMSQSKKQLTDPASKTSTDVYNLPKASKTGSRMGKRGRHHKGYELPTVASRMKQRGMRYEYGYNNITSIPFIVTKSITPSHNIGVNIQQVLNGMKSQQPICNIPLTLAHHMGLKHSPWHKVHQVRSMPPESTLNTCSVNVIKIGHRLLRLPSYKYMSYRRVLNLYREGDGMVPRYLRSQTRPSYFYQPTFSEAGREDIGSVMEGSTKRISSIEEMKQSLTEYVNLNREYQALSQKKGNDAETERRLEVLTKELAARETRVRQVVMAYNDCGQQPSTLQASASTLEGLECIRSAYRLRTGSEV